ncbi:hypothetical protein [Gordonia soli]|uniref:Uncharacterized protein n=1 Tax=Gordonia soli NBRC 108243 TaxID=1223545 RepID=M0QRG4_9ACTN|nr:hypothetical protein [Gordonia soli]GAC71064.1 hypothetical protein GS4_51_00020 [Gordonia soli NBRC 108243]
MSVVGIDPSLTACGIAVLHPCKVRTIDGTRMETEVRTLTAVGRKGTAGEGYTERARRIVAQQRRILRGTARQGWTGIPDDAELVVIEGPSYGSQHGAQMDRHALWMGVYSSLQSRGVRIAVCAPQTRAKWATGRGNARKGEVLAAAREQWPDERIPDDNCADALVLAAMGAHRLGWPLPFETKDRHTTGLDAIEWPEGINR